ncbi:hypothetical protein Scep_026713 [Stephania cephalantha]|uniref:Uncharacterized protein n=1 Tax=Stephania cephalantha TaxID=152367 RepID=A0AAP0EUL3_9MAGN
MLLLMVIRVFKDEEDEEDSFVFTHSQLEEMTGKNLLKKVNEKVENNEDKDNENKAFTQDFNQVQEEDDLVDDYNYYIDEYSDHEYFGDDEYENDSEDEDNYIMERSVASDELKGNEISVNDSGSSQVENYRYFPEDPCSISEDHDYFNFSIRSLLREVRQCRLSENSLVDVDSSGKEKEDSFVFLHLWEELIDKELLKAIKGEDEEEEKKKKDEETFNQKSRV